MSKGKKRDSNKQGQGNGYRRAWRDEKRSILDLLLEIDRSPIPLKGSWISFKCPDCSYENAVFNVAVLESYCGSCNKIRSIPYLMIASRGGDSLECKKDGS